jgi:ribosomal protein S18 acetylase RimI-like enzyme
MDHGEHAPALCATIAVMSTDGSKFFEIVSAAPDDAERWRDHLAIHMGESGRDGIVFAPYSALDPRPLETPDRLARTREALARPPSQPQWLRVFLAIEREGRIAGHLDLAGGTLRTDAHRCHLGIGVLAPFRGRRIGESLMRHAIRWARSESLVWMDLNVLDGNAPAIALYRKLGFVETGHVVDRFRIDGASIGDLSMSLDLRVRV